MKKPRCPCWGCAYLRTAYRPTLQQTQNAQTAHWLYVQGSARAKYDWSDWLTRNAISR